MLPAPLVWLIYKYQLAVFKLGTVKTEFFSKKSLKMAIGGIPKLKGKYSKQVLEEFQLYSKESEWKKC